MTTELIHTEALRRQTSPSTNGNASSTDVSAFNEAFDAGEVVWIDDVLVFDGAHPRAAVQPAPERRAEIVPLRPPPRPQEETQPSPPRPVGVPALAPVPVTPLATRRLTRPRVLPVTPAHVAWLAVAPVGLIAWIANLLAPSFAEALLPGATWTAFSSVKRAGWFQPEPFDQMRYLISLAVPLVIVVLAQRTWRQVSGRPRRQRLDLAVIAVQLAGLGLAVTSWIIHPDDASWFSGWDLVIALVVGLALLLMSRVVGLHASGVFGSRRRAKQALVLTLVAAVTGLWLLPLVALDANLARMGLSFGYHVQFLFDEFMSAANGRTAAVDFIPQYTKLLPYAVEPVLNAFGFTVGTLTWTMWTLALIAIVVIYLMFRVVTGGAVLALVPFVPFLAMAASGGYLLLPVRLFGPLVLAYLCVIQMQRPRRGGAPALFFLSGLIMFNNPELGLPCIPAVFAALWCGSDNSRPSWQRAKVLSAQAVAGVLGAFTLVSAITWARASSLPRWSYFNHFGRVFAIEGYGLEPMPLLGLHVIMYLTFLAALVGAVITAKASSPPRRPALNGMLAYSGVLGLLGFSYWVGRSQPDSLGVMSALWALCVALLAWWVMTAVAERRVPSVTTVRMWALPSLAVMVTLGLMVTKASEFPAPGKQLERLSSTVDPDLSSPAAYEVGVSYDRTAAVRFVSDNTKRGEHVVILASLGHGVAERSGVTNVSPFSHQYSIVFYEQMDILWKEMERGGASKVFLGHGYPEIPEYLEKRAYVMTTTDQESGLSLWLPAEGR